MKKYKKTRVIFAMLMAAMLMFSSLLGVSAASDAAPECICPCPPSGGITLDKSVQEECANPGDEVEYTFTVANSGQFPLFISIRDNMLWSGAKDIKALGHSQNFLKPGKSYTFTKKYTVPADAVPGSTITNTATAKGTMFPEFPIDPECGACDHCLQEFNATASATLKICPKDEPDGELKVIKKVVGTPPDGAEFKVEIKDDADNVVKTDWVIVPTGYVSETLAPGTYKIEEIVTSGADSVTYKDGATDITATRTFEIVAGATTSIKIINTYLDNGNGNGKGTLKIYKEVVGPAPDGAVFKVEIKDSENNVVETDWILDPTGYVSKDLDPGAYTILETEDSDANDVSYKDGDTDITDSKSFDISQGTTTTITIKNTFIDNGNGEDHYGDLKVIKTKGSKGGEPHVGVEFTLTPICDEPNDNGNATSLGIFGELTLSENGNNDDNNCAPLYATTDVGGIAWFNDLLPGLYTLTEDITGYTSAIVEVKKGEEDVPDFSEGIPVQEDTTTTVYVVNTKIPDNGNGNGDDEGIKVIKTRNSIGGNPISGIEFELWYCPEANNGQYEPADNGLENGENGCEWIKIATKTTNAQGIIIFDGDLEPGNYKLVEDLEGTDYEFNETASDPLEFYFDGQSLKVVRVVNNLPNGNGNGPPPSNGNGTTPARPGPGPTPSAPTDPTPTPTPTPVPTPEPTPTPPVIPDEPVKVDPIVTELPPELPRTGTGHIMLTGMGLLLAGGALVVRRLRP